MLMSPFANSAVISNGARCPTLGLVAKVLGISYKCVLSNSGISWQKQAVAKINSTPKSIPTKSNSGTWFKTFSEAGILAESCGQDGGLNLLLINSISGKTTANHSIPPFFLDPNLGAVKTSLCDRSIPVGGASNIFLREQFNRDFSDVTFTSSEQIDGSIHVGFLNSASNKFTDITALSFPTGFNASIPVDVSPIFDPGTGDFCFLRSASTGDLLGFVQTSPTSEILCYSLSERKISTIGSLDSSDSTQIGDEFLTLQNGVFVSGDLLVSPDSREFTYAGWDVNGGVEFLPVVGNVASYSYDPFNRSLPNETNLDDPFSTSSSEVLDWLGNDHVLISIDGSTGIYSIPPSLTSDTTVTPNNLLPESTAKNSNAILSPDQSKVAFIHSLLLNSALYIATVNAAIEPKILISASNTRLIEWQ